MARRAAEVVVIGPVEWHRGCRRSLSGSWSGAGAAEVNVRGVGVAQRAADVDSRSLELHGGRLRSMSGRWSERRAAEVAIPADNLRYPASVDIIARRKDPETK